MSLASYSTIKILNPSSHTFQPLSHQLPLTTPKTHTDSPIPRSWSDRSGDSVPGKAWHQSDIQQQKLLEQPRRQGACEVGPTVQTPR